MLPNFRSVAVRTLTVAPTDMHLSLDGAKPRPAKFGKCIASGTAQVHANLRAIYPAPIQTQFLPNFTKGTVLARSVSRASINERFRDSYYRIS